MIRENYPIIELATGMQSTTISIFYGSKNYIKLLILNKIIGTEENDSLGLKKQKKRMIYVFTSILAKKVI
jgi:hypothetical protein